MLTKIQIKTIFGAIAFEFEKENNTIKDTVIELLKQKSGAWIQSVDLSGMDLSGIDFSGAKFDNSTFDNSTFDNSTFYNSTFYNSKFDNSKFDNSTFYNSTFYNSKFYNSKFDNSTFYNSKFDNSKFDNSTILNIRNANQLEMFDSYKADFWMKCLIRKNEIEGLRLALVEGRIAGSSYEGECACFVGTIANVAGCHYKNIEGLKPDAESPTEKWFLQIRKGDTSEKSEVVKLTVEWLDEFIALIKK